MDRFFKTCLLGGALIAAAPAAAQQAAPPSDQSEIVVTGTKDMERQVRDFVGALTAAPTHGQLSRFESKVCPAALGLSGSQKRAVEDRMRRVAAAAGLPVGRPGCVVNILVFVTSDKRAFLETLNRKYSKYFGELSNAAVHRLAHAPGGAAAWQLQGPPISASGVELGQTGDPGAEYYVNRTITASSHITPPVRPQFDGAAVVVETGALVGLTTTQLADYAAMRTFAKTDPARLPAEGPPTILKVLDAPIGTAVPPTLTEWDLGFLRALYASSNKVYAASQRSEMRERIAKDLQSRRDQPAE
ncbi:MAG: hypothetical protein ACJ8EB_02385 [Allosphingosinicella sp.]